MERTEREVERLRLEMARRALVGTTVGQVSPASGACRPRGGRGEADATRGALLGRFASRPRREAAAQKVRKRFSIFIF
jgi:hypothetical protein